MQKRILLFGGTGNTGLAFIKLALAAGHLVVAVVRNQASLKTITGLQIIKGNIFNAAFLQETITVVQPDVIISCLGVHGTNIFNRTKLYSDSMTAFIKAMQAAGITNRIICISSWGSRNAKENNWILQYLLKPLLFAGFIHDMALMETILEKSSVDYTIVRPSGLTDKAATGNILIQENHYQNTQGKWTITRADLAAILLDIAAYNRYIKKGIAVTNK